MTEAQRPYKLYWVATPSPEENCFVAARSKRSAEKFEEDGTGFNPRDCVAEFVLQLNNTWVAQYLRNGDSSAIEPFYVQFEDVRELGIEWRVIEGDDVFECNGKRYVKQGDLNYIALLGRKRSQKVIVRSVADLLEIIDRDAPGDWIFRGHGSHRWKLAASAHRLADELGLASDEFVLLERQVLSEFKRRTRIFLQSRPVSDWEWIVIAQHFGLPTRILDWTENPLVALYFSIRDRKEASRDGVLFAYRHGADAIDIESTINPFGIKQIELLRPPHLDQRVIAQQSVFTVEPTGLTKGSGRESSDLRYWHVSANHKDEIQEQLAKLGISESTLFPGLASVAAEIKAIAIQKKLVEKIFRRKADKLTQA
jgi:hypothetical protein